MTKPLITSAQVADLAEIYVETVRTSCGLCHKVGPLPKPAHYRRDNFVCVYDDYPGVVTGTPVLLGMAQLCALAPQMALALLAVADSYSSRFQEENDPAHQRLIAVVKKLREVIEK